MQMQPMTAKELEYIVDSISNEDLLIKQCAVTAVSANSAPLKQICGQMIQTHQQHMQTLLQSLQQHQQLAPTQPQN
ncbi:hypothetical protein Back11_62750 [Paenibacillus baekrokdamisoli]|uniref:Uncharacterized protein n=1 Tax=Paenibacillus baekrokdamisoli TaxID=1712516 RepID=A0A3G9J175_9BACL|nr:hypothetical protein [Paenibacillus baekrokdamisoli]MBB3069496.1 hypothetical protein [Paenibacillus baekrokdamisoli]BBH24930.1 hypothetical protein Back11_62750 [Paenibacillus baekrokdamisoli]